jgi:hypothetical protein
MCSSGLVRPTYQIRISIPAASARSSRSVIVFPLKVVSKAKRRRSGADWEPATRTVTFGALINIRPRQGNCTLEIQDPALRARIEQIVRTIFDI